MENHYVVWENPLYILWPCSIAMLNYQRVYPIKSHKTTIFLWFSYGLPMVKLPEGMFTKRIAHKNGFSGWIASGSWIITCCALGAWHDPGLNRGSTWELPRKIIFTMIFLGLIMGSIPLGTKFEWIKVCLNITRILRNSISNAEALCQMTFQGPVVSMAFENTWETWKWCGQHHRIFMIFPSSWKSGDPYFWGDVWGMTMCVFP